MGMPLLGRWGMGGMGSPLLTTLMAGGLGYMAGSNSAQQPAPYPPQYPYQGPPATSVPAGSTDNGTLAQLQLLGKLHDSGVLTNDEFEREKQQILRG